MRRCARARAREAGAQVVDKDGASGRGRRRRSSTQSDARARFLQRCRAVLLFAVGSRRVAGMNGFSIAENAYGAPRHASSTRRAEDQRHPVIQTAPQTVNERSGELYEFGAVGVYCSIEIKALGRDYVPFSSFSNSVGRRKAV